MIRNRCYFTIDVYTSYSSFKSMFLHYRTVVVCDFLWFFSSLVQLSHSTNSHMLQGNILNFLTHDASSYQILTFSLVPVFIYCRCKPVLECSSIFYQLSRHCNVSHLLLTVIVKSKYIYMLKWIYYFHFHLKLITIFKIISNFSH
jgi:hypothetical protein